MCERMNSFHVVVFRRSGAGPHPMPFQDVADGLVAHSTARVRHRSSNPIVSPRAIFRCDAYNQLFVFFVDAWSSWMRAILGTIELPRDKLAVPSEDRLRPHDARHLFERSPADTIPSNNTIVLFFQDDWTLNENLTLNVGLRWDKEDITDDNNNISPRVGFSWDPTGMGRTVVRGGYGRFYERLQLGFWSAFF